MIFVVVTFASSVRKQFENEFDDDFLGDSKINILMSIPLFAFRLPNTLNFNNFN